MGVRNPPGKRIRGGNDTVTKQEIDEKRAMEAVQLLRRSGVGYIMAKGSLHRDNIMMAQEVTLAGSDVEALVKIALQFAFSDPAALQGFIQHLYATQRRDMPFQAIR